MILIIQNGYHIPSIMRYLNGASYNIIKSFETDVSKTELSQYSIIIILGGHQSIIQINRYPYLKNVVEMIQKCIINEKPLLGICLGAQLIAYTLGCEINQCNQLNIGYDVKILGCENVFRCHQDYIIHNDQITILEYFENMPYLYKYKHFIYGIQCHPDLTPESVKLHSRDDASIKYSDANYNQINLINTKIIQHLINIVKKIDL